MDSINTIPDNILFDLIRKLLDFTRSDFEKNRDEKDTFLYQVFRNTGGIDRYDYFEQAKKVIVGTSDDQRKLKVLKGFDRERFTKPTIHVLMGGEKSMKHGIGSDEGFEETEFFDDTLEYSPSYNERFNASYDIMVTSDNDNEVTIIYSFLKAGILSSKDHLESLGLQEIGFSGNVRSINTDTADALMMRILTVDFQYEINMPRVFRDKFVSQLIFTQQNISNE